MGFYSWEFCDCNGRLIIGKSAYLLMPDGKHIREHYYNGYGRFGAHDIYELMAMQNLEFLKSAGGLGFYVIAPGEESEYGSKEFYERALRRYNLSVRRLEDFVAQKDDAYMNSCYGTDWLREIGIGLDYCPIEYRSQLPFRIKVASEPVDYYSVPPSKYDERQGCY